MPRVLNIIAPHSSFIAARQQAADMTVRCENSTNVPNIFLGTFLDLPHLRRNARLRRSSFGEFTTMWKVADAALAPLTDVELVDKAVNGETAAFVELMRRYNRKLYQTAGALAGANLDAEDIVQETWMRAYAHLADFRKQSALTTWLFRILTNEALGRKRKAKLAREFEALSGEAMSSVIIFPSSHGIDPESSVARTQMRHLLESAIDALPDDFRQVVVLRLVEELSGVEVADILGIPEATVKTRLHRARALIQRQLVRNASDAFVDVFPFAGARCEALRNRVLLQLGLPIT
jgi:RNA polymerase sigma-70 factor, ECF subfamily